MMLAGELIDNIRINCGWRGDGLCCVMLPSLSALVFRVQPYHVIVLKERSTPEGNLTCFCHSGANYGDWA